MYKLRSVRVRLHTGNMIVMVLSQCLQKILEVSKNCKYVDESTAENVVYAVCIYGQYLYIFYVNILIYRKYT